MLRRHKLRVAGAIVLTLAAALGAWFFLSGDTSPGTDISAAEPVVSTDELDGFTNEELLEAGLRLTALDAGVQPDVSQVEAERVALAESPPLGDGVLGEAFAQVKWSAPNCRPCNAWVFSLDVSDLPYHDSFLALVDATTGEYLGGIGTCSLDRSDECP